jgi:tetratricopeptide (TPR) repeat protein
MYRSSLFFTAALIGTPILLGQMPVQAKSPAQLARSVTVEIKLKLKGTNGSGVIIQRQGNLYTLVTSRHVICGKVNCQSFSGSEVYTLQLPDGQKYQAQKSEIQLIGNNVDLAIIQFRSNRNYTVANVAKQDSLKVSDEVYTAGYPFEQSGFSIGKGTAIAVVNKRLQGDSGGYTIIYDSFTLPGMSGGGVFNNSGQLVAIHGVGDRYQENTDIENRPQIGSKTGFNRGIPIRWVVQGLAEAGINRGNRGSISGIKAARQQVPVSADEYFITGFNKLMNPGDKTITDKQQAIQEFTAAIQLNPKYEYAYLLRALAYKQTKKFQQSLADYNTVITALNPKSYEAYNGRSRLKYENLNDVQGALADCNQMIAINPELPEAYNNRGVLRNDKLKDVQGALTDYNQAISLDPQYFLTYRNRGTLKKFKLNNIKGALADYSQAISLNPRDYRAYNARGFLKSNDLNDAQGALADYNQAIFINPSDSPTYGRRGTLKNEKLNDVQGALADYNQAISLDPQNYQAYARRGILKTTKLKDRAGAIQDFRQAAKLSREQGNTQFSQVAVRVLKEELGATE